MRPIHWTVDAKGETAEFFIYDVIGKTEWGMGVGADALRDALGATKGIKNLNVRINSPGGSGFEGVAMKNLLETSGRRVTVDVDGVAASAASIVMLAGEKRRIADGGFVMIHNASVLSYGTAAQLRADADFVEKVSGEIAQLYTKHTGIAVDEIQALMNAETWMTASESVERGFATGVSEGKKLMNCTSLVRFSYRNTPKQLLELPEGMTMEQARFDLQMAELERQIASSRQAKGKA